MSEREAYDSINFYLLAASSLLGEHERAVFNALEVLKNHNVNSLPIEAWSEDLIISTLATLAVIAKNASPEKRRSIDIITENIKRIMCENYTE